ncbi:hypothetical protein Bca52824_082505 [Brassica carinata]|uniref:Uncharacterized protein n=1 Tax=Brassica carinata TaxID=52824 RepID=A0A8X7TS81_BRACI|nr:hypothetical protein Bca52824_082498 [Brassica carinata]KAG2252367.1 hypothetical protein Bca52824_082503 [Brassica carinata]KAG2252369.1 hypothetical protein Bca52824_082505 [Brassica carinata]
MRCKRHTVDLTSTGVCASCLHERLLSLAASIAVEENNNHRLSRKSSNPLLLSLALTPEEEEEISEQDLIQSQIRVFLLVVAVVDLFVSLHRSLQKQPAIDDVISGCRGMSPARDAGAEDGNEVPSGSIEETPGRTGRTPAVKTPGGGRL